ncbi:MAG TPA: calcium-binding protein, partial [Pirellulaceae bacterium]|nr:calcium-binding protein [Pirellulaceae bacterium]
LLGSSANSGTYSFTAPETEANVSYSSIETVNAGTVDYHLVLDMQASGFQNAAADTVDARVNAANFELRVNSTLFFTGASASILSFTLIGSSDNDTLSITETATGLPYFSGAAPSLTIGGGGSSNGSHLNSAADAFLTQLAGGTWDASDATLHFEGRTGVNDIVVNYTTAHHAGYWSDSSDTANSGNIGSVSTGAPTTPDLLVSFANLAPITWVGAGGSLMLDATGTSATTQLTLSDSGGPAGQNQVTGNFGFETNYFSGFGSLSVIGGDGAETMTIASVDGADPDGAGAGAALASVTLDADNLQSGPPYTAPNGSDTSNDVLVVQTLPATVTATLLGGGGNDQFQIYYNSGGGDTVDGILGQVVVSPVGNDESGGSDSLTVRDVSDASGDTFTLTSTAIDGLFDSGAGVDITYAQIESLTINLGTGADSATLNFGGVSGELTSVSITGNDGADSFSFSSSTGSGNTTSISGNANSDSFIFADGAQLLGAASSLNGNAGADTLDFSAFAGGRSVLLTGTGGTDGYAGNEAAWTAGASFTNIDTLVGSSGATDLLTGANLNNYWNLTGLTNAGNLSDGITDTSGRIGGGSGITRDIDFSSIERLEGGGSNDWFVIGAGTSLTGTLGGGGNGGNGDTLDYRTRGAAVTVNLTANSATAIGGGLTSFGGDTGSSIENVLGGSGADSIRGDADSNIIAGYDGADTLNGDQGVDTIYGDNGNDLIQVRDDEAEFDSISGGTGEALDPADYDLMLNIGAGPVTLNGFNTVFNAFDNSIDEYDGNDFNLIGNTSGNELHLGFTIMTDTPSVLSGDGADDVTTSYDNNTAAALAYDGGNNSDHVTLVFTPNQFIDFTDADLFALQGYLIAPTGQTLTVTSAPTKGNFTATNFESADAAVFDDGLIINITRCVLALATRAQLIVGSDTATPDTITGTPLTDLI